MKTIGVLLLLFLPFVAFADEGYVHGENHCYYFNSPKGWVLDNVSGKNQGMPMVSYPKSSSWAKAITVIYSHNADFVPGAKTPQEKIKGQIDRVLEDFRTSGAGPDLQARFVRTVKSMSGAKGEIWKFSGDKWGNLELVAYFAGPHTVNFFVMSSRDPKDFERSAPALLEFASSYREANDCVPCENTTTSCGGQSEARR